jgi:hypothetical protein
VTDLGSGSFRLTGTLPVYGTVFVQNQRTREGNLKGPLTQYELTVLAENKDTMILWYETDNGDQSSPVAFEIDRLNPSIGDGGP